jgi:hypothetical protein
MKSRFTIGYIYHLEAMGGIEEGDGGLSTTAGTVSTPLPFPPPPTYPLSPSICFPSFLRRENTTGRHEKLLQGARR